MRAFALRIGSGLAAVLLAAAAQAQQTCYQWRLQTLNSTAMNMEWVDDPKAAHQQASTYCSANSGVAPCKVACGNGQFTDGFSISLYGTMPNFPNVNAPAYMQATCSSNGFAINLPLAIPYRVNPGGCSNCPAAGTPINAAIPDTAGAGSELCGGDGCVYKVKSPIRTIMGKGGVTRVATASSTGRACSSTQAYSSLDKADSQDCVEGSSVQACGDPDGGGGQGCGYFNGDYVCTGHVPDNSCVSFASGGTACVVSSGGAPTSADVPTDSGGEPIEPDGVLTSGDTTINYYTGGTLSGNSGAGGANPATVAGQGGSALGAPGRGGSAPSTGSGGSGSGGGGVGDGELSCDPGEEDCGELEEGEDGDSGAGDLANTGPCYVQGEGALGALQACGTAAVESVRSTLADSDLVELVSGLADAVPSGGACPHSTFSAFDETFDFMESGCEVMEEAAPVLSLCFLIMWGFVGLRILLKTF